MRSIHAADSQQERNTMRFAVVGAGIFGASTAYHLVREGAEVVVVDAAHEGKATMAGAGIVSPWATRNRDPDFVRLYLLGGQYYGHLVPELMEAGETDVGYRRTGTLVLTQDAAERDATEALIRDRAAVAPNTGEISRLSGRDLQGLFPPLRDDLEAIHISGGARVEARTLAAAMLRVVEARGGRMVQGEADLAIENGRAICRGPDGRAIEADGVVVTAGAWATRILDPVGASVPVEPQKGQIIHMRLPGVDTRAWPVILPTNGYYMLAFDDSRVVVGATRETGSGFDCRVTAGGVSEVLNVGLSLAPGLHGATLIETRVGLRPAGPGPAPILSRAAKADNLIIGNGLGAGGLTMGPICGKLLAGIALRQSAEIDLSPYSLAA
jgi:D-amino-acid dehydrogenase